MDVRVGLVEADVPPGTDALLAAYLAAGVPADEVLAVDGAARQQLQHLQGLCLLQWRTADAAAVPLVRGTPLPQPAGLPSGTPVVSRFAVLRRGEQGWHLESGRSPWQVRLQPRALTRLGDLSAPEAEGLRTLLGWTGMLDDDDGDAAGLGWEAHDRYFVSRSRGDLPREPGYRLQGARPAEPARRSDAPGAERIPLPAPDGPRPDEPTLWQATENRRSVRTFTDDPVPLVALGALLWRTLRVVEVIPADRDAPYERVRRPVPSGGAMHALDLWLLCSRVEGVRNGVWRYDPFTHELVGSSPATSPGADLPAFDVDGRRPPIVGVLTARHARTSWKYAGVALSLELKDVGVVFEALQLTAGALGLGMCPWGSGPTRLLARVLGVDEEIDMPVGEFILGVPD